jgi:hypothetical protein
VCCVHIVVEVLRSKFKPVKQPSLLDTSALSPLLSTLSQLDKVSASTDNVYHATSASYTPSQEIAAVCFCRNASQRLTSSTATATHVTRHHSKTRWSFFGFPDAETQEAMGNT